METVNVRSRVGRDGVLHLDIVSGYADMDLDVTVTLHPAANCSPKDTKESWPPGFFENVIGSWKGEPLTREDAGTYEVREEL